MIEKRKHYADPPTTGGVVVVTVWMQEIEALDISIPDDSLVRLVEAIDAFADECEESVRDELSAELAARSIMQRGSYCDICGATFAGAHPTVTTVLAGPRGSARPLLFVHKECLASDVDDFYAGCYGGAWLTREACLASLQRLRDDATIKLSGKDQAAIDRYARWCRTDWQ